MSEEKCMKEDVLNDMKTRIGKLEESDREDYGARRELSLSIKLLAKTSEEQSKTTVEVGKILVKVNENLDTLSRENKEIQTDVNELKDKVNDQNIENIKKTSWDFIDFIRTRGIAFLVGGGIIFAILQLIEK